MAKRWNEVQANPDYQKLSVSEKSAAREQYFNEVVAPQIGADEHGAAYQQFAQENPLVSGKAANMGNIRDSSGKGFREYDTPEAGAYDQMRLLTDYSTKHGLNTITGISGKWAPSNENDTKNYANTVGNLSGLDINQKLDLSDPNILGALGYAQAVMEKGRDNVPFTREQYIAMAGHTGLYARNAPQTQQEAPQQPTEQQPTQPQPQEQTTQQNAAQEATAPDSNDPYAAMKNAYGAQRQQIEVPEWQKDSEALKLSVMGTKDKADWQHPLSYLSPYATINDVPATTVANAEKDQAMGRDLLKTGVYGAAMAATEGFAAPLMAAFDVSAPLAGVTSRALGNAAGSVSSQSTEAIDNPQWQGISGGQVAQDVLAGEALHRLGNKIAPGSASRRAAITESRAADAARENRIQEISDDITHINRVAPELHGKSPQQIFNDPKLVDSFRKPGEVQAVPERLQQAMKGMYGNEQGQVMIDAAASKTHPTTNPAWQHTTDAAWKTPIGDQELGAVTRRLENEFAASERSRPQYTIDELQKLNQAYQSGSAINPNIPIAGTIFNPAMRMGDLSPAMMERLGVGSAERFGLRMGEGGEGNMFGLGQLTRQSNQEALNKAAFKAETEAKTMAGRKGEGSRLAQDDLSRLKFQHDQLVQQVQPTIQPYQEALTRQQELTDQLRGNLNPQDHLAVMQELNNVTNTVNQLRQSATQAQTMLDASQGQIEQQAQKVKDQIKLSTAYNKAAKTGKDYQSTRELSNYSAGKMAEAESLARGGKTKGFDQQAYTEQQTPRVIQENKESASKAAAQQAKFHSTPEHKLTSWLHFITKGTTLIPHLVASGYSRTVAKSIFNDIERTGGKNLTGDQLRKVMAFMIDNPATIGYVNSGDETSDKRNYEAEKKRLIQEYENSR
ncbi:hypothetical protein CB599_11700 [Salmonella enterica subsp. enterica serovar Adjame]|nr:hypothetical protein [Salmonella enterica subsp. enterica serovar Adjame]